MYYVPLTVDVFMHVSSDVVMHIAYGMNNKRPCQSYAWRRWLGSKVLIMVKTL